MVKAMRPRPSEEEMVDKLLEASKGMGTSLNEGFRSQLNTFEQQENGSRDKTAYALMVIPTMVGTILLSPKVIKEAKLYFSKL